MKIKWLSIVLGTVCIISLTGCQEEITQLEVKTIVLEEHTGNFGKVEVIAIDHKGSEYIVKWKNLENCESGIDYIHDKTGVMKKGERTIC